MKAFLLLLLCCACDVTGSRGVCVTKDFTVPAISAAELNANLDATGVGALSEPFSLRLDDSTDGATLTSIVVLPQTSSVTLQAPIGDVLTLALEAPGLPSLYLVSVDPNGAITYSGKDILPYMGTGETFSGFATIMGGFAVPQTAVTLILCSEVTGFKQEL